jgi:hypothetical protein
MTMFIAFGAAFEVPVVVVVLARMGHGQHREAARVPQLLHRHRPSSSRPSSRRPTWCRSSRWRSRCACSTRSASGRRRSSSSTPRHRAEEAAARRPDCAPSAGQLSRPHLGPLRDGDVELQRLVTALYRHHRSLARLQGRHRAEQLRSVGDRLVTATFVTTSPGRTPPALAGPSCSTPVISTPWRHRQVQRLRDLGREVARLHADPAARDLAVTSSALPSPGAPC